MKTSICLLAAFALCLSAPALNELGPLDEARAKHPAVFVPGNVLEYSVAGTSGYVFNGEAERCFAGDMAESDSELYQEAVLDAKNNLRKYLANHKKAEAFQMSGARKLYEYPDGKMRRVVLFVAKEAISAHPPQTAHVGEAGNGKAPVARKTPAPMARPAASSAVSQNNAGAASGNGALRAKTPEKSRKENPPEDDRLALYLKQINDNPGDCIAMSKAAKTYVRRGNPSGARMLYDRIVKTVLENEKMDKMFAAGLLMEAARFERNSGNANQALKYYRLFVRCNGLRRWKLDDMADEANKNISALLLKAD